MKVRMGVDAREGGLSAVTVRPWVTTVFRAALATVLAWAGGAKITEPPALQRLAVEAYQILPRSLSGAVGYGLPIAELMLAVLLIVGFATRFTAVMTGVLMVAFIVGIISVWARGLSIDCGCFGGGGTVARGQTRYLQEILRDTVFLALAAWIVASPRSRLALDGLFGLYPDDVPGRAHRRGEDGSEGSADAEENR